MHSEEPVTLYIVTEPVDKQRLQPLVRVLVNMIVRLSATGLSFEGGMPKPNYRHRLLLMLDEFPSLGKLDILQESLAFLPGIMTLSSIATTDDDTFDRLVAVNLKGTFNGLREAAKRLRTGGRIINFSTSVIGLRLETYGVYAATKSAIETLTAILSKELRGRSITVNAIAPGPTGTDLFLQGKSQELIDRFAKMNPLERLGTPQDIAAAVAFLAGPDGSWINGQVLRANGGMV
jgi:3-oxoacyl-[acyl-carrier protein] reductase